MMIGKTVGQYEILEKIGEGGMGEVYLAQDTTLDRQVALKFLRSDLQSDEKAKQRLIREAKAVAALNQPFICSIHGVGEEEGSTYFAMEYVEGDTLQKRLYTGSLPLREALKIAAETAEALGNAHQNGIIHRDLKPSNIMITPDGHAKVMDFGLAKSIEGASSIEENIRSLTMSLTDQEMVVGTISYMSPEQIRAEVLDARSDIFSFGILLYEIITGHHPFRTVSPIETAAAIIGKETPPLSDDIGDAKLILQPLLESMLAKDVSQRPHSMQDVQLELSQLLEATTSYDGLLLRLPKQKNRWVPVGIAGIILVIAALIVSPWRQEEESFTIGGSPEWFTANHPEAMEFAPSLSPRGDLIAYQSDVHDYFGDIYKSDMLGNTSNLTEDNTTFDFAPEWSPDGQQIAFISFRDGRGGVFTMSQMGGRKRRLVYLQNISPGPITPSLLSWRCPDWIVYPDRLREYGNVYHIFHVSVSDRSSQCLTDSLMHHAIRGDISLSGRYLLCEGRGAGESEQLGIYLIDLVTEAYKRLDIEAGRTPGWGSDDSYIHFLRWEGGWRNCNLFSVEVDTLDLTVKGEEFRRTSNVRINTFDFDPTGSRVLVNEASNARSSVFRFQEDSGTLPNTTMGDRITDGDIIYDALYLFPNGNDFLIKADVQDQVSLFKLSVDRPEVRIEIDAIPKGSRIRRPIVSPDGRWIIVSVRADSATSWVPYILDSDGNNPRIIQSTEDVMFESLLIHDWHANGNMVTFYARSHEPSPQRDHIGYAVIDPDNGMLNRITLLDVSPTTDTQAFPTWSPDGNYICYQTRTSGFRSVWIVHKSGSNPHPIISNDLLLNNPLRIPGIAVSITICGWSAESNYLYLSCGFLGGICRVRVDDSGNAAGQLELWRELMRAYRFYHPFSFHEGQVLLCVTRQNSELAFINFPN